jgi:tetratricopeptide (TPR) repeat protein
MFYTLKPRALTFIRTLSPLVLLACSGTLFADAAQQSQMCNGNSTFNRVNLLLANKQYDDAAKLLDQFRACPGRSPLETFQLGWLYGRARRFKEALQVFRAVPHEIPDPLTHDYAIALSSFELGEYQNVIDVLKPHELSGAADEKSVNLLAVSYSQLHLYREAYAVLSKEASRNSSDLTTYLNLVTVCAEGGDLAKAAEVAAQARRSFPDSPDVLIVQGAAETQLGQLDQAYKDFVAAARLAPARADARFFVALIDYKQGKYADAVSVLQTAVADGIVDSDLHYLMAECLLKLDSQNVNRSLEELNRAVELNRDSVSARTLRGKLLLDAGRPGEALTDLELANRLDPDSRSALYNLARAYRVTGRAADAQKAFQQLKERNSDTLDEFTDTRLNQALTGKTERQP